MTLRINFSSGEPSLGPGFARCLFVITLALILWAGFWVGPLRAADPQGMEPPLTQADIDGYIYLLPRLLGEAARNQATASLLLKESGLTRRRAAHVAAKIAIAQALNTGSMSPNQLTENQVPLSLHPTPDELRLVQINLISLQQAQFEARRTETKK